jgi:hypothetical protein
MMMKDWRGIAVAMLSFGIMVSLILFTVSAMINDEPAPQWLSYLIFTLFGAVIGVVATYVRRDEEDHGHRNGRGGSAPHVDDTFRPRPPH